MTTVATARVRRLGFADLESGVWGATWCEAEPFVAFGTLEPAVAIVDGSASLGGDGAEQWSLSGEAIECQVSPESEAISLPGIEGFDQLCRVRGRMTVSGTVREFDVRGVRGSLSAAAVDEYESVRDLSACFPEGDAISLTALRPPGAAGHNHDLVVSTVFEPEGIVTVAEPRLSTTYTAEGLPLRAGLELWLEQDESEEHYPRRAAGQALGAVAGATGERSELRARPLRWQSRGLNGAGVYLVTWAS